MGSKRDTPNDAPPAPNGPNGGAGGDPAADALPEYAAAEVRRLMRVQGITGKALAEKVGVSEPTFSRWLNRSQGMSLSNLQRLAEALGVAMSALLVPGVGPQGDPVALLEQQLRRRNQEAATAWAGLEQQVAAVRALLEAHDERVGVLDAQWQRVRQRLERTRRQERRVPLYLEKQRGDPRRGEDDPRAAVALSTVAVPLGHHEALGPRAFGLLVETDSVAGLGVRRGDVVFCNPDAPYVHESLCVVGCPSPEPVGETRPRAEWPLGLNLRQLTFGAGGAVRTRKVPLEDPAREYREVDFHVLGPVVLHTTTRRLPEGRPPEGADEGAEGEEPDPAGERGGPQTREGMRWANGEDHGDGADVRPLGPGRPRAPQPR